MHGTKTGLFTGAPAMNFAALKKAIPDESCFKLMCHVHGEVVRRLHNPARTERKGRAFSCLYNQSGLCQSALSVETLIGAL